MLARNLLGFLHFEICSDIILAFLSHCYFCTTISRKTIACDDCTRLRDMLFNKGAKIVLLLYLLFNSIVYREIIFRIQCPSQKIRLAEYHGPMDIARSSACRVDAAPKRYPNKISFYVNVIDFLR